MILLDENISDGQRARLRAWRIRAHQIGLDVGQQGMHDDAIIPLLLQLALPTFFTRDRDFYSPRLLHARYCLVYLDVIQSETATFIRRLLRHHRYDTRRKRQGAVLRVSHAGVYAWQGSRGQEDFVSWDEPVSARRRPGS